jgi:thiamine-monophosphate kinase
VSDGLLGDLAHVLERSRMGATIDLSAAPRLLAAGAQGLALPPARVEDLVFAGGDDYSSPSRRRRSTAPPSKRPRRMRRPQ